MNPILKKVLGEADDVVPVIANVPQSVLRKRRARGDMEKLLGEDKDEPVIPDGAEELDKSAEIVGKPLNKIVKVMQEPSRPMGGDKEAYMTPVSALTAPDATPEAQTPLDSSKVPQGSDEDGSEKFTAGELEKAAEAPETGLGQQNRSVKVMDVILGRKRTSNPTSTVADFADAGAIATEEGAAAALGIKTPLQEDAALHAKAFATTALVSAQDGGSMPEPTPTGNGKEILNAFRKFVA